MNNPEKLIRPELLNFTRYSSARDEAIQGRVWLNANESPFPCLMNDRLSLNRYPERQPKSLLPRLADFYGVSENRIIMTRGSDEGIDLLTRLFCSSGKDSIMICPPTFGMYHVCAGLQSANVIGVPLLRETGYQLDMEAIQSSHHENLKILFLCSPNNPTGNLLNKEDILDLCQFFSGRCIIIVDEAYVEFSGRKSIADCIERFPNLVVLRTFSKAWGLAAVRCGVILADKSIVQWILKIIPPYPVPITTSEVVLQTLTSKMELIHQQIDTVKSERTRMYHELKKLDSIKMVWESAANFLLVETFSAEKFMDYCMRHGIILRNMHGKHGLENCVRISIGLPEENDQLISALLEWK